MTETLLQIDGLQTYYGKIHALKGISLTVRQGQIVTLLGANGAGKSTLLRIAAGLQPPDEGRVSVAGHDVWDAPLPARAALGYAAEEPAFYEELSAAEYLAFVAAVRGLDPAARGRPGPVGDDEGGVIVERRPGREPDLRGGGIGVDRVGGR